jgi:hypothetical protein
VTHRVETAHSRRNVGGCGGPPCTPDRSGSRRRW